MPDVSRALLLPDFQDVSDGILKTLALYWDEIVIPDYVERLLCERQLETGEHGPSASFAALQNDGVVVVHETVAELPPAPTGTVPLIIAEKNLPHCIAGAEGIPRLLNALQPILEAFSQVDADGHATKERGPPTNEDLAPAIIDAVANMSREATSLVHIRFAPSRQTGKPHRIPHGGPRTQPLAAAGSRPDASARRTAADPESALSGVNRICSTSLYLNRLQDAFELAHYHNLAPVAHSVASHVGSLMGNYTEHVTRREVTLLSAAVDAFEVSDDTSVEDILLFRTRSKALLGRFRASLADLSSELQQNAAPLTLLASARDTYRNRVQPALADLEAAMNESRLRFFLRSLVGATAITLTPIEPVRAVEVGRKPCRPHSQLSFFT